MCVSILGGGSSALAGSVSTGAAPSPLLQAIDADGDGELSAEEITAAPDALRSHTDSEGKLSSGWLNALTGKGSGDPSDLFLCVAYALVALFFSSLCSIAEAVLLSVSPSYVANLEKEGHKSAARIQDVKTNVDRSLAAILTLNTIAHTVGSGGAGAYAARYWGQAYVGIAMIVLTLLILFVSEIIPKTIGAVYWRGLAPVTARFIQLLNVVLYPLIFVSELITKLLTGGKSHTTFSRDEFAAMAQIGAAKGQLDAEESRILTNLLAFPELCVGDIMTPNTVVFALQQDTPVHEVLAAHEHIAFTRIPIYASRPDDVTGFVLKTDLLLDQYKQDGQSPLKELRREIGATHDQTSLTHVLQQLLDQGSHILLVVDEHGGMEGIVTLEDVVETMMGIEIVDEADKHADMRELARKRWQERRKAYGINVAKDTAPPADREDPPG